MKLTIHLILLQCLAVFTPLLGICQNNTGTQSQSQNQSSQRAQTYGC